FAARPSRQSSSRSPPFAARSTIIIRIYSKTRVLSELLVDACLVAPKSLALNSQLVNKSWSYCNHTWRRICVNLRPPSPGRRPFPSASWCPSRARPLAISSLKGRDGGLKTRGKELKILANEWTSSAKRCAGLLLTAICLHNQLHTQHIRQRKDKDLKRLGIARLRSPALLLPTPIPPRTHFLALPLNFKPSQ
ncbi:hypothetical protein L227DRAFT_654576, partial [Lentinus tigrinus ALCF2SS1-6]